MVKKSIFTAILYVLFLFPSFAQQAALSSSEILLRIRKLNTLGSVLYFAAHPDDENTRLIAWLAQERNYRTAYLSLTRGDGGQNLIGTQQGVALGLIRTQELLAARSLDKGEQFFTSAYDFGFSKTYDETFDFWNKENTLREAVWIIRNFQPDIIINRFPPDKRGGHGHHQASAILSHEAFIAAADPTRFKEQLQWVKPWKAKRLLWNTANYGGMNNTAEDQLKVDIGGYNSLLGQSYGEIAAHSRSQHKSQGFGSASTRGSSIEYFADVDGDKATVDIMEGIETSWKRIKNSQPISDLITKIGNEYNPSSPQHSINDLFALRKLIQNIDDAYWKKQKTVEIDAIIFACAGIWVDATTDAAYYPLNTPFTVGLEAIVRNPNIEVELLTVDKTPVNRRLSTNNLWKDQVQQLWTKSTQPYWLEKPLAKGKFVIDDKNIGYPTNPDKPAVAFTFRINGEEITRQFDVHYRFVDPVRGEVYQPLAIVPPVTVSLSSTMLLNTNATAKTVTVNFTNNSRSTKRYQIKVSQPEGWTVTPAVLALDFSEHNTLTKVIQVKPSVDTSTKAVVSLMLDSMPLPAMHTLAYDHIPAITWFPAATITCQNVQLNNPVKKVAYLMGAGDLLPNALTHIGITTTILDPQKIDFNSLQQYDAILVGVRFLNVQPQSEAILALLLDYVKQGGVVLYQYNVNGGINAQKIGPYPFAIGRERVTEENSPLTFDAKDVAFNYPNKITAQDFEGWIQERGLYFAEQIDKNYRSPLQIHDKGEPYHNGALLIANYGKGKFVYTSLSFFRQLPAGVPGAYRLFVNLLTKEK